MVINDMYFLQIFVIIRELFLRYVIVSVVTEISCKNKSKLMTGVFIVKKKRIKKHFSCKQQFTV